MGKNITGLTIKQDSVTAVTAAGNLKNLDVETWDYIEFPKYDLTKEGGPEKRFEKLKQVIFDIITRNGLQDSVFSISLPLEVFTHRNHRVPLKSRSKISQILPFELEPSLIKPMDQYTLRFSTREDDKGSDVIASLINTKEFDEYQELFSSLGMNVGMVIPGIFSSFNAQSLFSDFQDTTLISLDNNQATLALVVKGQIAYIRSFPCRESLSSDIITSITALSELCGMEFKSDTLYLTGRNKLLNKEFLIDLDYKLGQKISLCNLVNDSEITDEPLGNSWDPGVFDSALALTLTQMSGKHRMNFSEGINPYLKMWNEHRPGLIFMSVMIFYMFITFFISDFMSLKKETEEINTKIIALYQSSFKGNIDPKLVDQLPARMKSEVKSLEKKSGSRNTKESSIRSIDILSDISSGITKEIDVEFNRYTSTGGTLLLTGNTDGFAAIENIKKSLEKIRYFEHVELSSSNADKRSNRVNFKLKVTLKDS